MVAVIHELREPDGLGHELLVEWGQWDRDDSEGRQSWAVKPRIDPGVHGDPPERVIFVGRLVAQHRLRHHAHWRPIASYYLRDRAVWEIARYLGWSEDRVLGVLNHVAGIIEREYLDRIGTYG